MIAQEQNVCCSIRNRSTVFFDRIFLIPQELPDDRRPLQCPLWGRGRQKGKGVHGICCIKSERLVRFFK